MTETHWCLENRISSVKHSLIGSLHAQLIIFIDTKKICVRVRQKT